MRIWIDVEDLFQYAANTSRPSGIQRLTFELQRAMLNLAPGNVRFVRHGRSKNDFVSVSFSELSAMFANLSGAERGRTSTVDEKEEETLPLVGPIRGAARRIMAGLPPDAARALRHFRSHQADAIRDLGDLFRAWLRRNSAASLVAGSWSSPLAQEEGLSFRAAQPGDWLICLSSPWFLEDYAKRISFARERHGLRFGILFYDIIPLRHPEWCDRNLVRAFRSWFHDILPLVDVALAISQATAEDVMRYVAEMKIELRCPVLTIPLGTGFGQPPAPVRTTRLPPPKSYALIVSTIEARKNHIILFRIWRELLAVMPREQVPTLVFAGRVGWLVADLMQQLENADWLDGKIKLIEEPSDGELAVLYEDCLFTLYPSLYEGWGLPVTESLAHGAPCLASDRTAIPEAGGRFARYFDPDNLHEALRAVRTLLDDPATLADWRADIRQNFRNLPGWEDSAAATLRALQCPSIADQQSLLPPAPVRTC